MHVVAREHLGVPQSSAQARRIRPEPGRKMRAMVGFRNVAMHEYQNLDLEILMSARLSTGLPLACSGLIYAAVPSTAPGSVMASVIVGEFV